MAGHSDNDIELQSDLEAQRAALLSRREQNEDSDDDGLTLNGTARSSMSIDNGPEKPQTLPDGAIKTSPKSNQTSFLIWTAVNTLSTIGIVSYSHHHTCKLLALIYFCPGLHKQKDIR